MARTAPPRPRAAPPPSGLALNTVRNHGATIGGKLDVHWRSEAVVWERERGFTGGKATARAG